MSESESVPDYSGFSTRVARESGQILKPKTSVQFLPLLDRTPSDPSSMLTAITLDEEITKKSGQEQTVFSAEQQSYCVMVDIIWSILPDGNWKLHVLVARIG